ncbi:translation initiation factor IF-2 [Pseudonocardia parietis]|uniref:translation initiation factor IF-2 n=1 Tax=Pseudonocardia parietis TaxID=570936 RepID=UPI001AE7F596|nr:translation initiation factor IF-2 [Pseudonocardia parietis]
MTTTDQEVGSRTACGAGKIAGRSVTSADPRRTPAMAAKGWKGSKRASTNVVRERVSRLTAARDALDAEQAERRRREDTAFTRYAEAAARAETITGERDAALEQLQGERARVEQRAAERLGEVETEQQTVLVELNAAGRSAEELAALFELPVKRVRTLLRAARSTTTKGPNAAAARADSAPVTRSRSTTTAADHSGSDDPASSSESERATSASTGAAVVGAGHVDVGPAAGDGSPGNE